MTTEITRTPNGDGSFVVQRLVDGEMQTLKETAVSGGEVTDPDSELVTTETITITRRIGEKITF